ncbi:hypothetical protein ACIP93_22165 [Streptomyces sp. NPDC088745]|uniref:hypothetical protein n=1 Tax=Streptomyces sp. NPDC088745 TaxID=3365884 RepID=UPI0038194FD7
MAVQGDVDDVCGEEGGADRRRFADALRDLYAAMPGDKQVACAKRWGIPTSTLSLYLTGQRVPRRARLQQIVRCAAEASQGELPFALSEMERLRAAAHRRPQRAAAKVDVNAATAIGRQTDAGTVSVRRPASVSAGDRQGGFSLPSAVSVTVQELLAAEAAGEQRRMVGLIWSVSRTKAPEELSGVIARLHALRREDLAEEVLRGGRERSQADALRLSLALIRRGLTAHAELVMSAAVPESTA